MVSSKSGILRRCVFAMDRRAERDRVAGMKNNFASVKIGQKFTWQNGSFWMVKTGDDSATYLDGSQLEAANKPSAFRVCGKIKR